MGIDYTASLGYGFEIPSKIVKDVDDLEDLLTDNIFDFGFNGDSYADNDKIFLFIKKSSIRVSTYDKPVCIKPEKMMVQVEWDEKLKAWAKEQKISNPKIGWYLLASVS